MSVVHLEAINRDFYAIMWCGEIVFIAENGDLTPPEFDFATAPLGLPNVTCEKCKQQASSPKKISSVLVGDRT